MNDQVTVKKHSQKRQRNWQIKIPCLEKEFNEVASAAQSAGMSKAAYGRAKILGDSGPRSLRRLPADAAVIRRAEVLLVKYGTNLNQIAHHLNRGDSVFPLLPELGDCLHQWREIYSALRSAIGMPTDQPKPDTV